jgi:hypothetical protein
MSGIVGTFGLYEALKTVGFPIPSECRNVELHMGVDAAFILHYEVFVTDENLVKLGRALQRLGAQDTAPTFTAPCGEAFATEEAMQAHAATCTRRSVHTTAPRAAGP